MPLSALQHLIFCERQCALIHIERMWVDNALTVEGGHLHRVVDAAVPESRGDLRVARRVPLRSLRLGLTGLADLVEFHATAEETSNRMIPSSRLAFGGSDDCWAAVPVEYKRGKPKRDASDAVQLCAQALCLEEMFDCDVSEGFIFYGKLRRRHSVRFDGKLRAETERAAERLHLLLRQGVTPVVSKEPKCDRCSLFSACRPDAIGSGKSAREYLRAGLGAAAGETDGSGMA